MKIRTFIKMAAMAMATSALGLSAKGMTQESTGEKSKGNKTVKKICVEEHFSTLDREKNFKGPGAGVEYTHPLWGIPFEYSCGQSGVLPVLVGISGPL